MTWWMWTLAPVIYVVIGLFAARHEYVADVKQEGRADDTGYYVFTALVWPAYLVMRLGIAPLIDVIKLFFDAPLRKHRAEEAERKQAITFWTQEWDKADPGSPECDVAWQALKSMGMVPDAETQFRKRRRLERDPDWRTRYMTDAAVDNRAALRRVNARRYNLGDGIDIEEDDWVTEPRQARGYSPGGIASSTDEFFHEHYDMGQAKEQP